MLHPLTLYDGCRWPVEGCRKRLFFISNWYYFLKTEKLNNFLTTAARKMYYKINIRKLLVRKEFEIVECGRKIAFIFIKKTNYFLTIDNLLVT